MPLGAGEHPLTEPRGLVPVQLRDQRQREGQSAVVALALGLLVDQQPPWKRWMLRRTVRVLLGRSTSFHCSARASDYRRPSARATVQRAEFLTRAAASRTACLIEVESGGDVAGFCAGGSTRPGQEPSLSAVTGITRVRDAPDAG
jgi:hypothetical protein